MTDDAIQAALRDMASTVGGLNSTVSHMVETWKRQELDATAGRRALHVKVDEVRKELGQINEKLAGALRDIAVMKPIVDRIRELRSEARGVGKMARWIWAAGGFLFAMAGWAASHFHIGLVLGP